MSECETVQLFVQLFFLSPGLALYTSWQLCEGPLVNTTNVGLPAGTRQPHAWVVEVSASSGYEICEFIIHPCNNYRT